MNLQKNIIKSLFVLLIVSSLLNINIFGELSLAPYFFSSISILLASSVVIIFTTYSNGFLFPISVTPLFLLTAYILITSSYYSSTILFSNYWIVSTVYLFALLLFLSRYKYLDGVGNHEYEKVKAFIHRVIIAVAIIQSLLVILQWLNVIPSLNQYFKATGSSENPNVTALFLAFSIFSYVKQFKTANSSRKRSILLVGGLLLIISILLLGCRSAYIVTLLFLLLIIKNNASFLKLSNIRKRFSFAIIGLIFIILYALIIISNSKSNSTISRIQIWQRALVMCTENPIMGYGLGSFEKVYNTLKSHQKSASSGHVNMAYNDFIQLFFELGLIGVLLWIIFLIYLIRLFYKERNTEGQVLVCSFIIVQLTNFGFQAIPAFYLFLTNIALYIIDARNSINYFIKIKCRICNFYSFKAMALAATVFLLNFNLCLAKGFYKKNKLVHSEANFQNYNDYLFLPPIIKQFPSFHESFGDYYLYRNNPKAALQEYLKGYESCSYPTLILKIGKVYRQLNILDTSNRYFFLLENLDTNLIVPHYELLKNYLYQKNIKDVIEESRFIINMRIKIPGKKINSIKSYASKVLDSIETTKSLNYK